MEVEFDCQCGGIISPDKTVSLHNEDGKIIPGKCEECGDEIEFQISVNIK